MNMAIVPGVPLVVRGDSAAVAFVVETAVEASPLAAWGVPARK
jgi:hypothetical protein